MIIKLPVVFAVAKNPFYFVAYNVLFGNGNPLLYPSNLAMVKLKRGIVWLNMYMYVYNNRVKVLSVHSVMLKCKDHQLYTATTTTTTTWITDRPAVTIIETRKIIDV